MLNLNQQKEMGLVACFGGGHSVAAAGTNTGNTVPAVPTQTSAATYGAKVAASEQKRRGFGSTILTSGLGVSSPSSDKKTLLGS